MHLGKVTILHISLRSIAEYFAKNSLRSFGKNFCKQFASLIWQKESLYRANFATFASLNICKIILNVRSAHYLQINLCTLAMLAHKLGPSLGFFGCLTLFYFGLLQQVGGRYTYYACNNCPLPYLKMGAFATLNRVEFNLNFFRVAT